MAESLLDEAFTDVSYFYTTYYYSIITAVVIVLVGFIIGKFLSKLVQRTLHGMEIDSILRKSTQTTIKLEQPLASVTRYLIYTVAVIMALNQLHVTTTILQMIIAGVILIVVIAAALAIKDFIPNAVSGFYILKNRLIVKGQVISTCGVTGKVVAVTLVETKIQTKEGDMVHVPNSSITKSELMTLRGSKRKKMKVGKNKKGFFF